MGAPPVRAQGPRVPACERLWGRPDELGPLQPRGRAQQQVTRASLERSRNQKQKQFVAIKQWYPGNYMAGLTYVQQAVL